MTQDGETRDTRHRTIYDVVLFGILMVLLFLPLLQAHVLHIPLKPLNGMTIETEKPEFDLETYQSGDYAKQEEAYLSQHFGFREPVIRLYNQYLWWCYRKTYAKDVVAGKKGWLYIPESVRDYYGEELLRWHPSMEEAQQSFDLEAKHLDWVRSILKENGVELMAFMAPEKGVLYSEYLPERECDDTIFNACKYFERKFVESGFPCIEMTRWFEQMKDIVDYSLIPQTGAHWLFPSVYATDSLLRYMETLNGWNLPKIQIGELHESDNHGADNDLEQLLNLSLPIWHRFGFSPTAEVNIERDSTTVKPRVLFIGNSFMWGITNHVPMRKVFDNVEFWYYFSTAYYGDSLQETIPVAQLNLLEKLLDFDYIVWFTTGNQMCKGTNGFANAALLALCASDSLLRVTREHIADSLSIEGSVAEVFQQTQKILLAHPEIISGLRGNTLPTLRNDEIPYAKYIKDIRKDSAWMAALQVQGFLRSASMRFMLHAETDRIREGKPLYRDQQAEIQFGQRCQQEVKDLMEKMRNTPISMEKVTQKAEQKGKTIDKALEDDAQWLIRRKYKLDGCRLTDNPDAEIPLPPDFQSK